MTADGTPDPVQRLDPVLQHHIVNTLGWPDLRPLQRAAIGPLLDGDDALLLAPTAGGKTEAACFPLLTAMAQQHWSGVSVLYLCPLKALLNNLAWRVDTYAQWIGRSAAVWHGDVAESRRARIRRELPDILLTTPESLEAMLIGTTTDHVRLLGGVRAVVVDEAHAFAGDDRGWHLLAVLERLQRLVERIGTAERRRTAEPRTRAGRSGRSGGFGRPLQRIGLSATVGNPDQMLTWLQGTGAGARPGRVVAPEAEGAPEPGTAAGAGSGSSGAGDGWGDNWSTGWSENWGNGWGDNGGDSAAGPGARPAPSAGSAAAQPGAAQSGAAQSGAAQPSTTEPVMGGATTDEPAAGEGTGRSEVELDYVGSLDNAARLLAALHQGEKRLVFCDSRRQVEQLGAALRARGITTFLSHASLSAGERARSEQAFAEARNCTIVSTSTLELGIDVGDLDRVIQIDAPATVASFRQRLGRTGRRTGSRRNCLFLATHEETLLQAAGVLLLWGRDWVEPVTAPPDPAHLVAQQLLAVALQQHKLGDQMWDREWNGLPPFDRSAEPILRYLVREGFLDKDGGLLFIGPEAEQRFGHRHFSALTASFTAPPQFTVLSGRTEIGMIDPSVLTEQRNGPRRLLLGGQSWQVTFVDWARRRVFVEPVEGGGVAKWTAGGTAGLSHALCRAMREVLLGADPPAALTRRAETCLRTLRDEKAADRVHPAGTLITRDGADVRWWTWAGYRANATLTATLASVTDPVQRPTDFCVRLREDLTRDMWRAARRHAGDDLVLPQVDPRAAQGLKFSAALPEHLATATVAARLADPEGARAVLAEPVRLHLGRR